MTEFRFRANGKEYSFSIHTNDPKELIYKAENKLINLIESDSFELENRARRFLISNISLSYVEYIGKNKNCVDLGTINVTTKSKREKLYERDIIPITLIELPVSHKDTQIFISHSEKDSKSVDIIAYELIRAGIVPYVAEYDPAITTLDDKIKNGIDKCDYFLVFWTENAKNSRRVISEIEIANKKHKTIIPFVEKNIEPYHLFYPLVCYRFRSISEFYNKLVNVVTYLKSDDITELREVYQKDRHVRDIIKDIKCEYNLESRDVVKLFYSNRMTTIPENLKIGDLVKMDPSLAKVENDISQVMVWIKKL